MSRTINRTPAQWAIFSANSQLKRLAYRGRIQRPPLKQHITVIDPDGSRIEVSRTVNADRPDVASVITGTAVSAAVVEGSAPPHAVKAVGVTNPPGASDADPEAVPEAFPTGPQPSIRRTFIANQLVVIVSLCGRIGRGLWVALEAADWDRIAALHGTRWTLQGDGGRFAYVRGGKRGRVHLARVVMEAAPGEAVEFIHRRQVGSLMAGIDLRRCNLRLVPALLQRKPHTTA